VVRDKGVPLGLARTRISSNLLSAPSSYTSQVDEELTLG
jgi:hypothetical protein